MSTLDELERELGPALRRTLGSMVAGPDADAPHDGRDVAPGEVLDVTVRPAHRGGGGRRPWFIGVAAAAIAVFGIAAVALTRSPQSATDVDRVTPTTPRNSVDSSVPADDATSTLNETRLAWVLAPEVGSLARSDVYGVVAGPAGFVATGVGYDDQANQGRVWFSPDGLSWQEPAFDLFDALVVSRPVATSTAFFVVAASNTDRTPADEGEGEGPLPDARLYRSVDGVAWEPWGESLGELPMLASAGDGLLRFAMFGDRTLWWSGDGLTWSRADFADGSGDGGAFFPNFGPVMTFDGSHYFNGYRQGEFAVWVSDDGRTWRLVSSPPATGVIAAAGDRLILIADIDPLSCNDAVARVAQDDPITITNDAPSNCRRTRTTYRYDSTAQSWQEVAADGPGLPPVAPNVTNVGDLLVATVIEPGGSMTAWTSLSIDIAWRPEPSSTLDFVECPLEPIPLPQGGSCGTSGNAPAVAASAERVVIASSRGLVDGKTVIQVGTPQG
jgi:hypothetical protein